MLPTVMLTVHNLQERHRLTWRSAAAFEGNLVLIVITVYQDDTTKRSCADVY